MCYTFDHPHKYFEKYKEYNIEPISVFHNILEFKRFGKEKNNVELLSNYWIEGKDKYDMKGLKELEDKLKAFSRLICFMDILFNSSTDISQPVPAV